MKKNKTHIAIGTLLCAGLATFLIFFASPNKRQSNQTNDSQTNQSSVSLNAEGIKPEDVYQNLQSEADFAYDHSDPKILAEKADVIMTIKVKTSTFTNFELRKNEFQTLVMNTGEAEVLSVEKGDFNIDQTINWEKPGGYVTVEDYEKGQTAGTLEKMQRLRAEAGLKELSAEEKRQKYVRDFFTPEDKELIAGKTYRIHAINSDNPEKTYQFVKNGIEIIGFEYGAIEVK